MRFPNRPPRARTAGGHSLVVALVPLLLSACIRGEGEPGAPSASPAAREAAATPSVAPQRQTPGTRRDLARDEELGGHTLSRHVGKTDDELRKRLSRERGISAASTYADVATAEAVVGMALATASEPLRRWLARDGRRPNLVLDFAGDGRPIGRSLRRGDRTSRTATRAVVVLRWDERRGDWFVLTSYPEAPR